MSTRSMTFFKLPGSAKLSGRGAVDPEDGTLYVASERINDGVVEVDIIAIYDSGGTDTVRN